MTSRRPTSTDSFTVTKERHQMTAFARIHSYFQSQFAARTEVRRLALIAALASFACLLAAGPAAAASPWWNLNTSARPATIPTGGEGTLVVRASNLGNKTTEGASQISLTLPSGAGVVEEGGVPRIFFQNFANEEDLGPSGFIGSLLEFCKVNGRTITCSTAAQNPEFGGLELMAPLLPYEYIELRVKVKDEGAAPGAEFQAEASGGGAGSLSRSRVLPIGPEAVKFGAEAYELASEGEGGVRDSRAGAHPYQLTATFNLNQEAEDASEVQAPRLARNLAFRLPAGQIGNATAVPTCNPLDFAHVVQGGEENLCSQDTVIGVATVTVFEPNVLGLKTYPVPLFNLTPAFGEPARFGFELAQAPVTLDTSVRSGKPGTLGGDYGVTVSAHNTTQLVNFISSTVTFWGVPGDPSHDQQRGWSCLIGGHWSKEAGRNLLCEPENQEKPAAFLTLPTNCAVPFATSAEGESWSSLGHPAQAFAAFDGADPFSLTACNQLPFDPHIASEPTSNAATSPTGLGFDINFEDEGLTNGTGRAQSQMKKAVVSLPQGFTTNPSVAEGLKACSEAEYESATLEPNSGCTAESKVGEVEVTSPLVQPNQIVKGGIYVARQGENPYGNLLTLYLIVREPEIGVLLKQALKVVANPVTGQLTTEVDNVPQLPFSHFHLFFRPGQRAPLVTPPACGPYTVRALMYPYSNPGSPVERTSSFQITSGPEGQGCPSGGVPPFHPTLLAGSENPTAGAYSPFYTDITRKDSEQEITRFSIKLPPGVIGKLAGVSSCSDAAIASAKAREKEGGGQEELHSPSCPANSEVGHSNVGSGVGNVLAYAPGKLYLAGPYHGSNISIVSITAAKVGPFDLGTVVVRFALRIDPETAEVFVDSQGSDPIPHIVDGIPVHLRDIQAVVDRPNFTLNPTSCAKKSTASTVLGSGLNFASEADDQPVTITSPFQVASCASLGFAPKLALSLKGATKRGGTPAFKAVLTYPKGSYANVARSVVTLPHSEFLEQSHIGTVCTRVQFKEGKVPGEKCPKASIYGKAKAVTPLLSEPLKGPVYLRSSSHNLPDLVAALHNKQVDFALDGRIDSVQNGRIRNTFETVPDAPVSKFVLEMQGGKKGLLVNSTNLCKGTNRAISEFTGQNGKLHDTNPVVAAKCGGKGKKKGKRRS